MNQIYGIKNCDTVKKALAWLNAHAIPYTFFDVKSCGLTLKQVEAWRAALGAEQLINQRGTSWRQLTQAEKTAALTPQGLAIVLANPSLIKRPLLETGSGLYVGFSESQYATLFGIPPTP